MEHPWSSTKHVFFLTRAEETYDPRNARANKIRPKKFEFTAFLLTRVEETYDQPNARANKIRLKICI